MIEVPLTEEERALCEEFARHMSECQLCDAWVRRTAGAIALVLSLWSGPVVPRAPGPSCPTGARLWSQLERFTRENVPDGGPQ